MGKEIHGFEEFMHIWFINISRNLYLWTLNLCSADQQKSTKISVPGGKVPQQLIV